MKKPHSLVADALRSRAVTYRRAAETLPVHFTMVHKVAMGLREPGIDLAVALEREYGIRVEEWPSLRGPVAELLRLRGAA